MTSLLWKNMIALLPQYERKLDARLLSIFEGEWHNWHRNALTASIIPNNSEEGMFLSFLKHSLNTSVQRISDLRQASDAFVQYYTLLTNNIEREFALFEYAAALGSNPTELAKDRKAFKSRWFGADALQDRAQARIADQERRIVLALKLLGEHIGICLRDTQEIERIIFWQNSDLESTLIGLLNFKGAVQVKRAALSCLRKGLLGFSPDARTNSLHPNTSAFVHSCALDIHDDVWVQLEAISLLAEISPTNFLEVVSFRLREYPNEDDIFLRRGILTLIAGLIAITPEFSTYALLSLGDPSPYVRQGLAEILPQMPDNAVVMLLPALLQDQQHQVRAQTILSLGILIGKPNSLPLLHWLEHCLTRENNSFVLRTALLVCNKMFDASFDDSANIASFKDIAKALEHLHQGAPDLRVRRWAAEALMHMHISQDRDTHALSAVLHTVIASAPVGKQLLLPPHFDNVKADTLACSALPLTANNYGLDFEQRNGRWLVTRGHQFCFRLWRWLYELRHPSPDKRQAFKHTIGRIFNGSLHVPSSILAELAQTKVPGEPLHQGSEAGWRPYLPLPDELISSIYLSQNQLPLRIYTAEGVTEITPPTNFWQRLRLRMTLTWRFADFAQARNWQEQSNQSASHYINLLKQEGFSVRFIPHPNTPPDPAVLRFFPAGLSASFVDTDLWQDFQTYLFSIYGNTLIELSIFATAILAGFLVRHIILNRRMQNARKDIPLVIGGWGTRGKSGTERLKAALFNSMGYSVISKTTGCEAMFLHNHPFQPLKEMFLFRPYDKATIWEQLNVTCLASKLKADVLLWECMALTPAFVELLQQRWMRDDLSTITNTFPDHEDLQGPAGINIPEVMTRFIPRNSTLITSEEQMRPILAEAATAQDTRILGVGWLESGLLTPDVLDRFPYEEHPDNIALVVQMAIEMGIPANYALKEIADKVIPDLGVLQVFPTSHLEGRTLTFANGMSANERFGCLGNWHRLGFDRMDTLAQPESLISTVVNNRADRVARSRVFASILVNDISADLHFLIGSNLEGLIGYINEDWALHISALSLWPKDGTPAIEVFAHQVRKLRIPDSEEGLRRRLSVMLGSVGVLVDVTTFDNCPDPVQLSEFLIKNGMQKSEEIVNFFAEMHTSYTEFMAFSHRVRTVGKLPNAALDADFRQQLGIWFRRKLIVVDDYYASGNRIIQAIARHTPPGFDNHIMGIQNIKGTGLDFVYRWQAWKQCHDACVNLRSEDPTRFRDGLGKLTTFQEYGLLTDEYVKESLIIAHNSLHAESSLVRAQLEQIAANIRTADQRVSTELGSAHKQGWIERIILLLEGFVDAGDAVRRRRTANRIYADMVTQRISHERATAELLKLTQKQKGGWLYDRIMTKLK